MLGRLERIVLGARDLVVQVLGRDPGGVLTGPEISRQVGLGNIVIEPFDESLVGPNSVDLHLGPELLVYGSSESMNSTPADTLYANVRWGRSIDDPLDPERLQPLLPVVPRSDGRWLLVPGRLYIGSTLERTETHGFLPVIDGRSSLGRLGVFAHVTAGRGDDGFCGRWTVEICVVEPVLLRPGGRYFQTTFHTLRGRRRPYAGRYQGDLGPVGSRIAQAWDLGAVRG